MSRGWESVEESPTAVHSGRGCPGVAMTVTLLVTMTVTLPVNAQGHRPYFLPSAGMLPLLPLSRWVARLAAPLCFRKAGKCRFWCPDAPR